MRRNRKIARRAAHQVHDDLDGQRGRIRQHLDRSFLSPIKGAPWCRAQARGIAGFFVIEQEIEGGLPGRAPRESKQRRSGSAAGAAEPDGSGRRSEPASALSSKIRAKHPFP